MNSIGIRTRALMPPKDSLKDALKQARFSPREKDIIVLSSKVVAIDEGTCVPTEGLDKESLLKKEADWYLQVPKAKWRRYFTIRDGLMASASGIDESNANGHYVLYPKDPFRSARRWRAFFRKTYGLKEVAVIITDSVSLPLHRGAVGTALAWDGIDPLHDYRGTPDIFGRTIQHEVSNVIDALAAAAVLEMGEGAEQVPVAIIRNVPGVVLRNRQRNTDQLIVSPKDDLFAPFFWQGKKWKRGGGGKRRN